MTKWEKNLKKGDLGEKIFIDFLEAKGWVVMVPNNKNKAHLCDLIATYEKEKVIAFDIKTKTKMRFRNSQGINYSNYKQYIAFSELNKIPFHLVFIDNVTGEVHSANLSELKDEFFNLDKSIIFWELKQMKFLFKITEEQKKELSLFST